MKNFLFLPIGILLIVGCDVGPNEFELHTLRAVTQFKDCGELTAHLKWMKKQERGATGQRLRGAVGQRQILGEVSTIASGSEFSSSNRQERNVAEPDFIKINSRAAFIVSGSDLHVVNHQLAERISSVPLAPLKNIEIFVTETKLFVVGSISDSVEVRFYDLNAEMIPSLTEARNYPGFYTGSRFHGGDLFLILQDNTQYREEPDETQFSQMACTQITRPLVEDLDYRMVKVIRIQTQQDGIPEKTVAVLGGGDQIYMTEDNLYIGKQDYIWHTRNPSSDNTLYLSKVRLHLDDGAMKVTAVGKVDGVVKDQWAFHENSLHGVVHVATTTFSRGLSGQTNHLWTLSQNQARMEVTGSVNDFGFNEDIRAIRYLNDMAYVVTFEKTDPLFAISLANPFSPVIEGELKVPGFSLYLHPASRERLVGVGYDTYAPNETFSLAQGIKASLFDVSQPMNLKELDVRTFGGRGSYSDITSRHQAYYSAPEGDIVGFPVVLFENGSVSNYVTEPASFTGAVVLRTHSDRFTNEQRFSHTEFIPGNCRGLLHTPSFWSRPRRSLDINRIFKIDDSLVMISRFALTKHNLDEPGLRQSTVALPTVQGNCRDYDEPGYR